MKETEDWEQRYRQGDTGWDRGDSSDNLAYWIQRAGLQPCRILVPGCGNGYEVLTLVDQGFEVVAVDIAPTPVEQLRRALGEAGLAAEVVEADFFNWSTPAAFDAIYEQTSLCALPPESWPAYEACLYRWLNPGGKLCAQFMQTGQNDGPPWHCDIGRMTELFAADRWSWSPEYFTGVMHSEGRYERVYLLEKRPAASSED